MFTAKKLIIVLGDVAFALEIIAVSNDKLEIVI